MIESLAEHGVQVSNQAPSLMTTHTMGNLEYDPVEGKKKEIADKEAEERRLHEEEEHPEDITNDATSPKPASEVPKTPVAPAAPYQTIANVLPPSVNEVMSSVSTSLSAVEKNVTLNVR